jgi:photosystem II stability/assembly factor-like uncharacterized protein
MLCRGALALLLFPTALGGPAAKEAYRWRSVAIVGGGFVPGIVAHPSRRGVVYCRTDIGGAYRLDPRTQRWIPLQDWLTQKDWNLYGAESIGLDPQDADRVYLAVGTYTNEWGGNGAILRSHDQGRTFERTDLPFKLGGNEDGRSIGERLAVDPGDGRVLYLGTRHSGLWRSTDRAVTWSRVESFPMDGVRDGLGVGIVFFDPRKVVRGRATQTIYVAVASRPDPLFRSTDGGATWEPLPEQPRGQIPHHAFLSSAGVLTVTYGNGPGPNGVTTGSVWQCLVDSGTWRDITPERPSPANSFGYAGLSVDAHHPETMLVSTIDRWSRHDDIFRTTDNGAHWTSLKEHAVMDASGSPFLKWGRPAADFGHWMGSVTMDPFNANRAWYGTGATIWATDDLTASDRGMPTHWHVGAGGIEEIAAIDLISPPAGPHLLSAVGDIGGFRHDDLSAPSPTGMYTNPLMNNVDCLDFAEQVPSTIVRVGRTPGGGPTGAISHDGGATWKPFASMPYHDAHSGSIAVSADGKTILWSPEPSRSSPGGVYRSADEGATWTETHRQAGRVVADRADARRFYLDLPVPNGLFVSEDAGLNFSGRAHRLDLIGELPKEHGKLRSVPGRPGHIWLPTAQGLFASTDTGGSFLRLGSVDSAKEVAFGAPPPAGYFPTVYIIGVVHGEAGVYRSDDQGRTWTEIDDDAHRYGTMDVIAADPRIYGRVYIGSNGRGILYGEPAK